MKKFLKILLMLLFLLLFSCNYQAKSDGDTIKNIIESFYNTQYESYLQMEYKDITPYLDMSKIQNRNKVIALKTLAIRRKYIEQNGYGYVEKRRFPLTFNYKSIDIKNDYAKVVLEINLDEQQAYPPFISSGKNVFELRKDDNNWKIISHSYSGLKVFEVTTDKKLPELDLEILQKQIDNEFK